MKRIRQIVKRIPGIKHLYRKFIAPILNIYKIFKVYKYDMTRFLKYGGHKPHKESLLAEIIMAYHVVEKGLTMPDMRLGFGKDNLVSLIGKLHKFAESYICDDHQFKHGVAVVAEYLEVHNKKEHQLDDNVVSEITALLKKYPTEASNQIDITREQYFSDLDAPFDKFSVSRHSVRNFEGEVSIEQITKAVKLANNAPSACNRQQCKVHVVTKKEDIDKCLDLQNGNRGFGYLADKLLIVTADVRASWTSECLDVRTNAGIYIMNLCYGLHLNKIGHCLLNWFTPPTQIVHYDGF